jgi:hypothetical protein
MIDIKPQRRWPTVKCFAAILRELNGQLCPGERAVVCEVGAINLDRDRASHWPFDWLDVFHSSRAVQSGTQRNLLVARLNDDPTPPLTTEPTITRRPLPTQPRVGLRHCSEDTIALAIENR